jgi:hypothetical protein
MRSCPPVWDRVLTIYVALVATAALVVELVNR